MTDNASFPILAAGLFGSAGMLLWGAAALLPLLLHLWNRNRHEVAPWAAMEFLLAAVQQQTRRMRLEQLLLLLLRMAIPLVLALALADPLWQWLPSLGTSLSSRPPHHHLLVFDASYSMGYQVNGRSRLEQAQQLSREIVEGSPQGDGFTLLLMAEPAEVIVATPAFDPLDITAEIAGLRLRDTDADLATTLELAKQIFKNVRTVHPRLEKHRAYFFSDFGANTWQATTHPRAGEQIGELESMAEIVTVDVGADAVTNAGISYVAREESVATIARPMSWQVTVTDFAGQSPKDMSVEMFIDGQLVDRQGVELASGAQGTARFAYRFDTAGQHRVEFHLTDDALPIDNHHYEVLTVRNSLRVLCVSGKTGSARNVAIALAPSPDDRTVTARVVADHQLPELDLAEFDCIFFCNVGRFTADNVSQLRDYLRLGRGVVMFLGDQVQPDNYNQRLASDTGWPAILPARIGALAPTGSYLFDPQGYQHAIIRPFRGQQRTGLLTTPVWQYYRLSMPTDSPSRVALQFTNGDPVILEHLVYRGRVILVATAPSEQSIRRQGGRLSPWTAWTAWPSFPPLVQEMMALAAGTEDESRNVLVGQSLGAALLRLSMADYVTITHGESGSTSSRRVPVRNDEGPASWSFDQTYRSGFYVASVAEDGAKQEQANFAVNLVTDEESKLARIPLVKLPSQFQRHSIANMSKESASVAKSSGPLFRLLLGLLLALLLLESFVAWFLGNARA